MKKTLTLATLGLAVALATAGQAQTFGMVTIDTSMLVTDAFGQAGSVGLVTPDTDLDDFPPEILPLIRGTGSIALDAATLIQLDQGRMMQGMTHMQRP